jgi:hypothetical protein
MAGKRTSDRTLDEQRSLFLRHVDKTDPGGCWLWLGRGATNGRYGSLRVDGRAVRAHRRSYELFVGPIPEGLDVLHSCDRGLCVNPAHLRPGTHRQNMDDAVERRRMHFADVTHCVNGHEFTPENTIHNTERGLPRRSCRECARAAGRRYHHAHKEKRADYARDYYQNRKEKVS